MFNWKKKEKKKKKEKRKEKCICVELFNEGNGKFIPFLRVLMEEMENSFPFLGVYTYAKAFGVFIYNRFPNVYICQLWGYCWNIFI